MEFCTAGSGHLLILGEEGGRLGRRRQVAEEATLVRSGRSPGFMTNSQRRTDNELTQSWQSTDNRGTSLVPKFRRRRAAYLLIFWIVSEH